MIININNKKIKISWAKLGFVTSIIAYFLYLVHDLNYNTAFVDEAIYATIGEEVLRGIYWEKAISWMGGSYIYPIVSAWINRSWGLVGVRFFAMIGLIITAIVVGKLGKQLGGNKTQFISTLLFLSSAATLNLGQLGTYDAPALAFTAMSTYTALLSRYSKRFRKYGWVFLSSILLALGILTKYIMILFVPIVALLILWQKNKIRLRTASVWTTAVYLIILSYTWVNLNDLIEFFTNSHFSEPAARSKILLEIFSALNIFILGAGAAFFLALKKVRGEKKLLLLIFFVAGLAPLAYHLGASNIRSMWKHLVFTTFYWAPITGWVIYKISNFLRNLFKQKVRLANLAQLGWVLAILTLVSSVWFNFSKHWQFQRSWPSATKSIEYLEKNRKPDDKIFAEASAIYKYHLFAGFEDPSAWASTWWVEYEGVQGVEGMKMAIRDKAYDYIILNYYYTTSINQELIWDIQQNYTEVLSDTYIVSGQYKNITRVWKPKKTNDLGRLLAGEDEKISIPSSF